MAAIKWYKRDPEAALTGMMILSLEERGAYNTVLDLIYTHGGKVMDDDRFLAGWMRCDVRVWKRIRDRLISLNKLYEDGEGFLRNSAADREVDDALLKIGSAREAGLASAAKRQSELLNNNRITPTPVERPLQLSTSTSTSTPIVPRGNDENFVKFWDGFPRARRGNMQKAFAAWRKAIGRATPDTIIAGLEAYAKSDEVRRGFAKGAAAWLNDDRWECQYGAAGDWLSLPQNQMPSPAGG